MGRSDSEFRPSVLPALCVRSRCGRGVGRADGYWGAARVKGKGKEQIVRGWREPQRRPDKARAAHRELQSRDSPFEELCLWRQCQPLDPLLAPSLAGATLRRRDLGVNIEADFSPSFSPFPCVSSVNQRVFAPWRTLQHLETVLVVITGRSAGSI